ncbi:MAG: peptide deformylase [Phyllobacterium sp.]
MAIRTILKFPDARLHARAEPVRDFGDELRLLADDLLETMRAAPGIGIAAPHLGVMKRLAVIEIERGAGPRVYVNPRIEWTSPELARHEEGSVSMPGVADTVERPARIRVRYQDLAGAEAGEEADGMLAICLQHEIDQLDGIFWTGRLSRLRRDRVIKRFHKLQRETGA